jgi:hypothetical protein
MGLTIAMVFGIFAHGYYGTEQIMQQQWIDIVFWSLIGTGIGVSMIQIFGDCVPCQLSRRVHAESLSRLFCDRMHCGR